VVAVDLQDNHLQTLLPQHSDRLEIIIGDISQRTTSEKGVNAATSRVGRLDAIILNAGIQTPVGSLLTVDVNFWKKCFDINFFSLIHSVSRHEAERAPTSVQGCRLQDCGQL
jgi:NADP-dependent 3-hydroxy acid dehydrogenase YdfG